MTDLPFCPAPQSRGLILGIGRYPLFLRFIDLAEVDPVASLGGAQVALVGIDAAHVPEHRGAQHFVLGLGVAWAANDAKLSARHAGRDLVRLIEVALFLEL
ncbi:hypothetical protein CFII68_15572 [Pseudomonas sp. CFII68]|nr:hypothetical protein CFII68_15572 [Pseudomonas sp. CFII68]